MISQRGNHVVRGVASLLLENFMPDLLTPLSDLCQTQLEASRRMVDAVFSGTGKIDRMFLDAAHRAFDEQLRYAQAVGNARDPQILANLQATFWSAKPEQVQHLQQEFMRTLAEMQNELGRATQAFIEQFGVSSMRVVPSALTMTPAAGIAKTQPGNPFAPMMSAWERALQGAAQLSDRTMASMRQAPRLVEAVADAAAAASSTSVDEQQSDGDGAGNGNGNRTGKTNGNGHVNGNGNGHGPDAAASHGSMQERRSSAQRDDKPRAVRAQDASDDPNESGNGAAGSGKKTAQNRRK
jgi:hypothetical protein